MSNYVSIKQYLKKRTLFNAGMIFVTKTKNSYLIGPFVDNKFDELTFYKRITSSTVRGIRDYKNINSKKAMELINMYKETLASNEILEVFYDGHMSKHKIIPLPGDINEE